VVSEKHVLRSVENEKIIEKNKLGYDDGLCAATPGNDMTESGVTAPDRQQLSVDHKNTYYTAVKAYYKYDILFLDNFFNLRVIKSKRFYNLVFVVNNELTVLDKFCFKGFNELLVRIKVILQVIY